jgi:hypothetical protein
VALCTLLAGPLGCDTSSPPDDAYSMEVASPVERDAPEVLDALEAPDADPCALDLPYPATEPVALSAPIDRASLLGELERALDASGHDVDRGAFGFFYIADCEGLPSCYGNNPASPYGFVMVPPAPEEALYAFGAGEAIFTRGESRAVFRLRADEVVVLWMTTPPESAYFGFTPYLFGRGGDTLFASLGDTVNQLVIATASTSASRFGAETALLFGADASRLDAARAALVAAGAPAGMINTVPLPTESATGEPLYAPGLGADADTLLVLFRVAVFSDTSAGADWLDAPNATVLRIRPREARTVAPLAAPVLRTPGSSCDESALRPALDALEASVRARFPTETHTVRTQGVIAAPLDGHRCIAGTAPLGPNCLGDNRDTHYLTTVTPAVLPEGTDLYVLGVNHALSGKAMYVTVATTDSVTLAGTGSVDADALVGSAAAFGGGDSLFVVRITRGACAPGEACLSVASTGWPSIPLDHPVRVLVRPYLDPATAVRPDPSELVLPRIVTVTELP